MRCTCENVQYKNEYISSRRSVLDKNFHSGTKEWYGAPKTLKSNISKTVRDRAKVIIDVR